MVLPLQRSGRGRRPERPALGGNGPDFAGFYHSCRAFACPSVAPRRRDSAPVAGHLEEERGLPVLPDVPAMAGGFFAPATSLKVFPKTWTRGWWALRKQYKPGKTSCGTRNQCR